MELKIKKWWVVSPESKVDGRTSVIVSDEPIKNARVMYEFLDLPHFLAETLGIIKRQARDLVFAKTIEMRLRAKVDELYRRLDNGV